MEVGVVGVFGGVAVIILPGDAMVDFKTGLLKSSTAAAPDSHKLFNIFVAKSVWGPPGISSTL